MSGELLTYPQALLGWREWRIRKSQLWPAHQGLFRVETAWPQAVVEASCLAPPGERLSGHHSPPEPGCLCGFHAYHSPASLHRWSSRKRAWLNLPVVMGLIAGAGKVCLHREGFRAQRAQVLALVRSGTRENRHAQERVASAYGVPLLSRSAALRLSERLGGPLSEGLISGLLGGEEPGALSGPAASEPGAQATLRE